jgi:Fe-S cluster assembly protein SufD
VTAIDTRATGDIVHPAARGYLEDFATFSENGASADPAWLTALRGNGIERFTQLGFPTTRNEDWHFTSVAPIAEARFLPLRDPSGTVEAEDLAPFTFGASWPTLVFVNGCHAAELSNTTGLPAGVSVLSFGAALRDTEAFVRRHLGQHASRDVHAFTALNTAFLNDGAVVHIAKDVEVTTPIHLLFITDANAAKGVMHPRTLIVADRHAKATVIESYVSPTDAWYFTNAVTEVVLGDGATLAHCRVQRESARAFHVGTTEATQGRDSHYVSFSFAIGGSLARTNIYTTLGGEGSGATLNGLYMLDGEQHSDHQTRIEHAEPNTFSRELYKGVLDDASHGVFNGKVFVRPVAQKTDGKQTNNTLLLSDRARIDTKPQLEIFADDVKCTHGATVGRIDETAKFYMLSRGIGAETARRLLTYAFAAEVLETIETAEVREGLERLTLVRFAGEESKEV